MRYNEILEGLPPKLAAAAGNIVRGIATTAEKNTQQFNKINQALELVQRQRGNLAQIEQLSANAHDFRALPDAITRLRALWHDLGDIAQHNAENTQVVARAQKLRDDLGGMIRHFSQNANQPMASGMFLQSIHRELVPLLKTKLQEIETVIKSAVVQP